jgi:cell wall-associated NlpC family hydrolase
MNAAPEFGSPRDQALQPPAAAAVEPRAGDLLLFYGGCKLGWWIERATRSPFYHVALYDRDGHVIDAVPRGVVRRHVADGTTGKRFVVARAPAGAGEAALAWAKTQVGRPFDALGMFVLLASLPLKRPPLPYRPTRRFTCSHLVAEAFLHAGVELFPGRGPALIVPGDFACLAAEADIARAWREGRGRVET